MKNLLIIFCTIFISLIASAQDGLNQSLEYYNKVLNNTTNLSQSKAIQLCIDLTENLEYQYGFVKQRSDDNGILVVFQLVEVYDITYRGNKNLSIWFSNDYTIKKIQGNKETIISIWQYLFLNNATIKDIEDSYKYKILKSYNVDIHYQIEDKDYFWIIRNRNLN